MILTLGKVMFLAVSPVIAVLSQCDGIPTHMLVPSRLGIGNCLHLSFSVYRLVVSGPQFRSSMFEGSTLPQ